MCGEARKLSETVRHFPLVSSGPEKDACAPVCVWWSVLCNWRRLDAGRVSVELGVAG